MGVRTRILATCLAILAATHPASGQSLIWHGWSADLFTKAKAENRFVLLDLEAVWCHWCHVMAKTTYRDPAVTELLAARYITVRVDQDAHPDLSSRYGDWGWPATIVFAPDGTEIVKRRGYIAPAAMTSLLKAIIEDPSPGPSVVEMPDIVPSAAAVLSEQRRNELKARSIAAFDDDYAGWGRIHKFIDVESMDWELRLAELGDRDAAKRARATLDAALKLLDRAQGGMFQYSDTIDWSSPHYEKIMLYQANGLRHYAAAYAMWKEPGHLEAASRIKLYLMETLRSPEGAFFTSQDADVSEDTPGRAFYALDRAGRAKLGLQPRIDTNIYARENGWAISGLVAYHAVTNDGEALSAAETAARWIVANRSMQDGGFRHGASDRAGPYLGDTIAMGQAALDLYAATGDRHWLTIAGKAGDFIAARFKDDAGGFRTTAEPEADTGVFVKPVKPLEEQVAVARFANRLHRYFGSDGYRQLAEHGARYLTADAVLDMPRPLPGVLLVDAELGQEPTHITIVGHKDDPRSLDLHAAGRSFPSVYKRLDWWDKREGPLPNPDVQYPDIEQPAAFACTERICSLPVFEPEELARTVAAMLGRNADGRTGDARH